jgi:hypothetical protein
VGKTLTINLGRPEAYTVTGVAAEAPDNSSLRFGVLLPFGANPDYRENKDERLNYFAVLTLVKVREGVSPAALGRKLDGFARRYFDDNIRAWRKDKLIGARRYRRGSDRHAAPGRPLRRPGDLAPHVEPALRVHPGQRGRAHPAHCLHQLHFAGPYQRRLAHAGSGPAEGNGRQPPPGYPPVVDRNAGAGGGGPGGLASSWPCCCCPPSTPLPTGNSPSSPCATPGGSRPCWGWACWSGRWPAGTRRRCWPGSTR